MDNWWMWFLAGMVTAWGLDTLIDLINSYLIKRKRNR